MQLFAEFLLSLSCVLSAERYELDVNGQVITVQYQSVAEKRLELKKIASQKLRQKFQAPKQHCAPSRNPFAPQCANQACIQKTVDKELQIMNKMRQMQKDAHVQ